MGTNVTIKALSTMSRAKQSYTKTQKTGFTLVELSLSMVFISTLSLAVVLVITGAVSSYHKSITLNQVNTVGADLVDDMRAAIQDSNSNRLTNQCSRLFGNGSGGGAPGEQNTPIKDCEEHGAQNLVSVTRYASVTKDGVSISDSDLPVFGALCTGSYSYIWNSGYFFSKDNHYIIGGGMEPASLLYIESGQTEIAAPKTNFRLLKIRDKERAVCVAAIKVSGNNVLDRYEVTNINGGSSVFNTTIPGIVSGDSVYTIDEEPAELLSNAEGGLALYDLTTSASEQAGIAKNIYYYTSFILGTVEGGVNIDPSGSSCKPPEEHNDNLTGNFDYCAINKFNFAAMANGG